MLSLALRWFIWQGMRRQGATSAEPQWDWNIEYLTMFKNKVKITLKPYSLALCRLIHICKKPELKIYHASTTTIVHIHVVPGMTCLCVGKRSLIDWRTEAGYLQTANRGLRPMSYVHIISIYIYFDFRNAMNVPPHSSISCRSQVIIKYAFEGNKFEFCYLQCKCFWMKTATVNFIGCQFRSYLWHFFTIYSYILYTIL
jgi:hypothetical protein